MGVFLTKCGFVSTTITSMYATYGLVQGEAVVDPGRQGDQVPLGHGDADPPVLLVPDVKVGPAVQDVADLVIQVKVLLKEHLQLPDTTRQRGWRSCFPNGVTGFPTG